MVQVVIYKRYKDILGKNDEVYQLLNCHGVLRMMLRISPVSGYPYLMGTMDCSLDNVYWEGLPLFLTAFKQFLLHLVEALEETGTHQP